MKIDKQSLRSAKQKYLKLYDEISQISDSSLRSNMLHTHSKLGIFISDGVRQNEGWTGADPITGVVKEGQGYRLIPPLIRRIKEGSDKIEKEKRNNDSKTI